MYYIRMDFNGTGEWTWVHYPGDDECVAWDKKLKLALNDAGCLDLTYARTNPVWGRVVARRTLVEVLNDKESLFIGEVRDITHDRMLNESVYAVGALAWLQNSIQGQEQFKNISIRQFLQRLLTDHNKQCPEHQFHLGIVSVTEPNADDETLLRYTNYGNTWATIKDRLVDRFDDTAIRMRRDGTAYYIDYVNVQDYGNECEQDVRFGENLLDYSDSLTTDDICSSVVPLGATITDEEGNPSKLGNIIEKRVTIESVNGGVNYVENAELVERFGHVRTTHTWDGVKTPTALKRKALEWISDGQWEQLSLKVQVADLTMAGEAFDAYRVGDRAYVVSEPYGLRKVYPIRSRTYDLDNPEQDELRLGADSGGSFVSSSVASSAQTALEAQDSQYAMGDMLSNAIQNVTAMMTGARGGYKYTEYDDQGRWLADYIMDSMDRATAQYVKKETVDGTAYSTHGIDGPYESAILANGMILGKYIEAGTITAEQISTEYTQLWEDADENLNQSVTKLISGPDGIEAKVTTLRGDVFGDSDRGVTGLKADMEAAIAVNAEAISLTVKKDGIQSAINQSATRILVNANKFGWTSTNSSLSTDGVLTAQSAVLNKATVNGTITTVSSDSKLVTKLYNGNLLVYYNNKLIGKLGAVTYSTSSGSGRSFDLWASDGIYIDSKIVVAENVSGGFYEEYYGKTATVNRMKFVNGIYVGGG
jgi:hypothetical protein